jgi:hypothetical protein
MAFTEEIEIPPIINKILKKLEEKGQLKIEEFKIMVLNIRIEKEDFKEIEYYLEQKGLIQRIPNLIPDNGVSRDIIAPTMKRFT